MNELTEIDPSWLIDEKCRALTHYYYDKLSPAIQFTLKDGIKELKLKDDYVNFLNSDGVVIWDEFIKDVAKSKKERDFSPLSDAEAEKLFAKIDDSYNHFTKITPPHSVSQNNSVVEKLSNPLFIRLGMAIFLLIGGFSVIFYTFFELPKITQQFQEETKRQVREDGIQDALNQVTRLIKSDDFEHMSEQINGLGLEFKNTQQSISKLSQLTSELALVRDQWKNEGKAIISQKSVIASASKIFTDKVNKFDTEITPLNTNLAKLANTIDGWADPKELRVAFEAANKELSSYDSNASRLLLTFSKTWDEVGEPGRAAWINDDERNAIDKIIDWSKTEAKSERLEGFRDALKEIEKQSKIILIDDALKISILNLEEQLKALLEAKLDLENTASNVTQASTKLNVAVDKLNNNQVLKGLGDGSDKLLETLGYASDIVFNSKESYNKTKQTLKKLEEATENLGGLARLQAELAFKGASPAILLLLAIGGMFVTFGLSSMLKWVKDIDEKQAIDTWARKNQLYTAISASLIQHGVDPAPVLSRLHNAFPTNEAEHAGIKFPISETFNEIGKMIQPKK